MADKKKRGRPKGSRMYDDTKHLVTIARMLLDDPSMSETAAQKKVALDAFPGNPEAAQKRFYRAWKEEDPQIMQRERNARFIRDVDIVVRGLNEAATKFAEKALPVVQAVGKVVSDKISRIDPEILRGASELSKRLHEAEKTMRSEQMLRIKTPRSF